MFGDDSSDDDSSGSGSDDESDWLVFDIYLCIVYVGKQIN